MLNKLIRKAEKRRVRLSPLIGIGCPGLIAPDGSIERGGQNLAGDWETPDFNLPHLIRRSTRSIGKQRTDVLLHNDAVVQGLSELPFVKHTTHWGVLTIGTGLGNTHFSACDKTCKR